MASANPFAGPPAAAWSQSPASLSPGPRAAAAPRSRATLSPSSPVASAPRQYSPSTPSTGSRGSKIRTKKKTRWCCQGPISWWWWWEIGAAILSSASMLLILLVLFKANDLSLESWPLWIQPNSLIAVFTTVGKTAMMVPVATCLSQLKWRHFQLRPSRLSHLQVFEDASRGPWGSIMLLLKIRARALTAGALALVSLVALGIDPAAQQILDFPQREIALTNATAQVGMAKIYTSKAYQADLHQETGSSAFATMFNPNLFKLQSSIIDGVAGSVFQPMYICPGARCSWQGFTTIGVCGEHRNMTDTVKVTCDGDTSTLLSCNHTFPSDLPVQHNPPEKPLVMSYASQDGRMSKPTTVFKSMSSGDRGAMLYSVRVMVGPFEVKSNTRTPPPTQSFYSAWYWCAKTYHDLTATPAGIRLGPITSERLVIDESRTGDPSVGGDRVYVAPSTNAAFNISSSVDNFLFDYLGRLLDNRLIQSMYPHAGSQFGNDSLDLAYFLHTADLGKSTVDLADALTHQIRSNGTGDNTNATMLAGTAFITETYIRVRWPWLTLPLVETVLTATLLAISMFLTRGQPLFKTSVIAFLTHGIEGWRPDELKINDPENAEKLEHLADSMTARLADDARGRLKLMRS